MVRFNRFSAIAFAISLSGAQKCFDVAVGEDGLSYTPDHIDSAPAGSQINFHFEGAHSVAQANFEKPCVPSGSNAIFSGVQQGNGIMWSITLNSTDPLWIYCTVGGHCTNGMVMVINPPSGQSIDQFKKAAGSATKAVPSATQGGSTASEASCKASATGTTLLTITTPTAAATITPGPWKDDELKV